MYLIQKSINIISNVKFLFAAISGEERQNSLKKYDAERQRMKDSVAFWRRADDESTANQARYSTSTTCLRTNMPKICKKSIGRVCSVSLLSFINIMVASLI